MTEKAMEETSKEPESKDGSEGNGREEEGKCRIQFDPPMSIQRYREVAAVLTRNEFRNEIKSVVDFGCSDLNFLKHLKGVPGVTHISAVDLDRGVVEQNKYRAAPLAADFIHRRTTPLSIALYRGSITDHDNRLRGYDAVTCIELIEHLHAETLEKVPNTIFGFIRPKVAIVTTPNADFNVMFPTLKQFRHWDHKFEWTRVEFFDWCTEVVTLYPRYKFTVSGIGDPPVGNENLGHCSQMAVFQLSTSECHEEPDSDLKEPYVLVGKYDHPYEKEKPTNERILNEVEYYVRFLGKRDEPSDEPVEIKISSLSNIPKISRLCGNEDVLRNILESGGWTITCRDGVHFITYNLQENDDDEDEEDDRGY